jgi:hypothetical protein
VLDVHVHTHTHARARTERERERARDRYKNWAGIVGSNYGGARSSSSVQTGPGADPSFYMVVTVSFLGMKRLGRDINFAPKSSADVKERVKLHLYSPFGPLGPILGRTLL